MATSVSGSCVVRPVLVAGGLTRAGSLNGSSSDNDQPIESDNSQFRQRASVMNALRCHGARASIAFRKIVQEGAAATAATPAAAVATVATTATGQSDRCQASFLCETGAQPVIMRLLSEKRGKQMLVVHPKQRVDLSKDWTSFMGTPSVFPPKGPSSSSSLSSTGDSGGPVFVLLEASPPKLDRQGRLTLRKVSRERVVKLSGLTTPLAWKSGEPFGILVQATPANFGLVGSAYLEGVLELDDGLLVEQIVCVDPVGKPFSLLNQDPKTPSPSPFPPSSPFHRLSTPSASSSTSTSTPGSGLPPAGAGAAAAAAAAAGIASREIRPLRRKHSQEFCRKMEEQHRRLSRKSSGESGQCAGSAAGDDNNSGSGVDDSASVQHQQQQKIGGGAESGDVSSASKEASVVKPPNILVYTGEGDLESAYEAALAFLERYVQPDRYVVYRLSRQQALHHPWSENCQLLLCLGAGRSPGPPGDDVRPKFEHYVRACGGSLLALGDPPKSGGAVPDVATVSYAAAAAVPVEELAVEFQGLCLGGTSGTAAADWFPGGQAKVLAESRGSPVITETTFPDSAGKVVLSKIPLHVACPESLVEGTEDFNKLKESNERRLKVIFHLLERLGLRCGQADLPGLTCGYLLPVNKDVENGFMGCIQPYLKDGQLTSRDLTMQFTSDPAKVRPATADFLPIVTGRASLGDSAPFDFDVYKANLRAKTLGNVVLYTEVLPTTMVLFESFMFKVLENVSVIAIATRLTKARGRGGNKWLGPIGCAMFSLHVRIPMGTLLADKLPFLQHITSVAVVEAVRSLKGYEDIDLRLKWPNDIYYADRMKLGGVIVNSTLLDNMFHAIIGCGFNVDNSEPTICINDLIRRHNKQTGAGLALLSTEQLLARTVDQIERIMEDFQQGREKSFLDLYYKRWLHSGKKVHLEEEDGPEVSVEGLDKAGFLLVKDQQGALHSVQPDGNSFDMTKNLVRMKERMK